jgi:hypothetical protein
MRIRLSPPRSSVIAPPVSHTPVCLHLAPERIRQNGGTWFWRSISSGMLTIQKSLAGFGQPNGVLWQRKT